MTTAPGSPVEVRVDLSVDGLRQAIVEDFAASAVRRRLLPGERVVDTPELLAYVSDVNSPDVNEVVMARFDGRPGEADDAATGESHKRDPDAIDAAIADTIALFGWRPFLWWVRPDDTPADLVERLARRGLVFLDEIPGMAMDLAELEDEAAVPPPAELDIRPVFDPADLDDFHSVLTHGFPEDWTDGAATGAVAAGTRAAAEAQAYREPNGVPTRWIGRVDGRPVATARIHAGAGVAGVYTVITVQDARRRGYGAAMTRQALLAARDAGLRIGTLQASDAGRGIYERIGFRELCRFRLYEWRSKDLR